VLPPQTHATARQLNHHCPEIGKIAKRQPHTVRGKSGYASRGP
jgi:hypothetical protein